MRMLDLAATAAPLPTVTTAPAAQAAPVAPAASPVGGAAASALYGMTVHDTDLPAALALVTGWMRRAEPRVVVTPNVDHFLRWQRSPEFRELYEGADLSVVDGAPLALLARLEGVAAPRVTGVDLFTVAVGAAAADGVPLVLVGGMPEVAERAAQRLMDRHPDLRVAFVTSPAPEDLASSDWVATLAAELRRHPRKLVALCLGSPKQERLFRELERIDPDLTGVYLCVGAAVDFAAGTLRRAPRLMQRLGIEWVFRLVMEPRRLWRRYLVDDRRIAGYLVRSALRRSR